MSTADTERRSSRKRKRNQRYTNDAFEVVGIVTSDDDKAVYDFADDASDDFDPGTVIEDVEVEEDDLEDETRADFSAEEEDANDAGGEQPEIEVEEDAESIIAVESPQSDGEKGRVVTRTKDKGAKIRRRHPDDVAPDDEVHTRGLRYRARHHARDYALLETYGDDAGAKLSLLRTQDQWFDEITLPSRKINAKGTGGISYSHFTSDEERKLEASRGWDWYYDQGGRAAFERHQRLETVAKDGLSSYLGEPQPRLQFVMGPQSQQKLFTLDARHSMNANDAWSNTAGTTKDTSQRRRWILNAGDYVQTLDWCPNQTGQSQYLALSTTKPSIVTKDSFRADPTKTAPAFAPAPAEPASIQIWEFRSTVSTQDTSSMIDMDYAPRLHTILCMDWGAVKELKWCPCFRDERDARVKQDRISLGLLAVRCGDAVARVLDISLDSAPSPSPHLTRISQAAWASKPPDTICTSLTWISPTHLAASCANGHIVVWDISTHLCRPLSSPSSSTSLTPTPILYHPLDTTYLLSLHSLRPSRPNLLAAASMSGHLHLFSLSSPHLSHTTSIRTRVGTSVLAWSDHIQHALSVEESQTCRAHNVRQFYQATLLTFEEAGVGCIATSQCHPVVLLGGLDGAAVAYNPVRRVMHRRTGADHYRQRWFGHEWRRGVELDGKGGSDDSCDAGRGGGGGDGDVTMTNGVDTPETVQPPPPPTTKASNTDPLDFPHGLSRLTTGYTVTRVLEARDVDTSTTSSTTAAPPKPPRKPKKGSKGGTTAVLGRSLRSKASGVIVSTIHEARTAITAVGWNPNIQVGGWAAAGCADGMVVVEDLCWD